VPIHILVARDRHLVAPSGVLLHRSAHVAERVQNNLCPPRERYEHAVLDVAESAGDDLSAIAELADACGARRTTPSRPAEALEKRPWARRRTWLAAVLGDVAKGTCSVLELDGRVGHTATRDRNRDLNRDLDALATQDLTTVRLGYGQVTPCPKCGAADQAA
jgi:hypothetical protein